MFMGIWTRIGWIVNVAPDREIHKTSVINSRMTFDKMPLTWVMEEEIREFIETNLSILLYDESSSVKYVCFTYFWIVCLL